LSSLSNKTILHNEKTFQNNWFYYSYPYYSGSSIFIFCEYSTTEGQQGAKAEALTDKIQAAINQTAWDSTAAVSFSFRGNHHYLWDKKRNLVQVEWGDKKVLYNTQTIEGIAENGKKLTDSENRCYKKGNDYFNNDSFWLIAPFKLRDAGTTSIVMQDNQEALMITYASGGSTPGIPMCGS
jgi:hypothetical protein